MHTPYPYKRLALHYVEMVAVMFAGMLALGAPLAALAGPTSDAMTLLGMGATMTVPMVGWMAWRGHERRATAEMALAMVLPTLGAVALLGPLGYENAMALEHVVMLVAMAGVMVARPHAYTRCARSAA